MKKWLHTLMLGAACCALQVQAQETTCDVDKPVVFAGFDWDSIAFHNSVARYILEHGYHCDTDEIPGSTIPLFNGMFRGNVDVAMEIWKQAVDQMWHDAVKDGTVKEIGVNVDDATQAFFVPRYLVEGDNAPAPDLHGVADLAQYAPLFADQEEPEKGRFYNCVLGWSCEKINTAKLYAYGLDKDFVNFRPGSGNAVSSAVESAILRHKPVLFYYWTPSWLMGKFGDQLVRLEEPPYDAEVWEKIVDATGEDGALQKVTEATAYPNTELMIGLNSRFSDKAPQLSEFFSKYHTNSKIVSEALADMQDNDTRGEDIAKRFLTKYPDLWRQWVPADVAERVQSTL